MKLLLNAKPYLHVAGLQTWGEWLDLLDADAARTGRLVTEVRFDGVDEPAFRAASLRERPLDSWASVDVDTATRSVLLADTARQGAAMVSSLADAAVSVGEAFRAVDLTEARALLPPLVDGIRSVVSLTDQCAAAAGVPRQALNCRGLSFDQWIQEFGERLAVLLDAHGQEDWLTAADSLEYEIAPALREWVQAFDGIATAAVG